MNKRCKNIIVILLLITGMVLSLFLTYLGFNYKKQKIDNNYGSSVSSSNEKNIYNGSSASQIIDQESSIQTNDQNMIHKVSNITFYNLESRINKYNYIKNNIKSNAYTITSKKQEENLFMEPNNVLLYINSNKEMVYERNGNIVKAKSINEKVKEYLYEWTEGTVEILVLSEQGNLFYWRSYDDQNTTYDFEFVKIDLNAKINGMMEIPAMLFRGMDSYDPWVVLAITDIGYKKINIYEKVLENISFPEYYKYVSTDLLLYEKMNENFDREKSVIVFFVSNDKNICLSKIPSFDEYDFGMTKNNYECNSLIDNNGVDLNVNKLFQTDTALFIVNDDGKIYKMPYNNGVTLSKRIKVENYNNKIVDEINYKKIEENEYLDEYYFKLKQIQIKYSDGSVEIFNLV